MARPTTKEQLVEASETNYEKLFETINVLCKEDQLKEFGFEDRDRNIRDVLVHLYEWHQLLLNWVDLNLSGNKTNFLPAPYNWKTYVEMNIVFWKNHQTTSLDEAISLLEKSHTDVLEKIKQFSNEELFTNKYFSWTGTTSLGSYSVSATSSHYDWAIKKIKKHVKEIKNKTK